MIWSLAVICGQVHHRVCCVGTSLSSVLFKFTTCVPAWSVWWISYMERARPDGHRRSPNISTCPAGWTSCTVFLVLFLHHLIWCVYKTAPVRSAEKRLKIAARTWATRRDHAIWINYRAKTYQHIYVYSAHPYASHIAFRPAFYDEMYYQLRWGFDAIFFYDGIWSFYVCVNIKNIYIDISLLRSIVVICLK